MRYQYEKEGVLTWSNYFVTEIRFASGYESNEEFGKKVFLDKYIIAIAYWETGSVSVFEVKRWTTSSMKINKREVMFNDATGEKIPIVTFGEIEPIKNRIWEVTFLE